MSLPTFATAQFKGFLDCGRAVRCLLPLGVGKFMHLVVQLSVVARGQPCMLVGDFNVEPTKIPCLAKGISAGLWVDLEVSWALATGKLFMVGCPLAAAAVVSGTVQADRWMTLHLAVSDFFLIMIAGHAESPSRFGIRLSDLLLGCLLTTKVGSKSVEVQKVWEIYDDGLQFMSRQDALLLDESFDAGDIFQAWLVWSCAAETFLRMPIAFLVDLPWVLSWGVGQAWLTQGSGRCEVMLLMCIKQLIFSCIEILHCLT